jgi:ubiquinone/menaquinone biosynthesis C-methylase UbiE
MEHIDFIERVHMSTKRNYLERVIEHNKAECAAVSKQFGRDYWDGDRRYGYGGYNYDGRWRSVAENIANHYNLETGSKILDIGCGKGFLLYEFAQVITGAQVVGIDVSKYAIDNGKEEIQRFLQIGNATNLPFEDNTFDLVVSINTLHNLYNFDLKRALQEMERVGKQNKYLVVDSYRTEEEKVNLLYWQITCECFYTPQEWEWFFQESGYTGDYSYIFYE